MAAAMAMVILVAFEIGKPSPNLASRKAVLKSMLSQIGPSPPTGGLQAGAVVPVDMRVRPAYAINGRFLSQSLTGVQRYAFEVVHALDALLEEGSSRADLMAPPLDQHPGFRSISLARPGVTSGYLWEQIELPLRAGNHILSLCNVAPLFSGANILCVHDANVFRCPDSYSWTFRNAYQALLPALARRALRLTTVSHSSRKDIAHFFSIDAARIAVLPNGHEHVLGWRQERSGIAERVAGFRPFVLLIGSRARHKNIRRIRGLADELAACNIDVVVAGGGAGIFAFEDGPLAKNIHVLGRVSDDDLALLYRHALCLAFPSISEGFGLPLVEAMALGCPVVASAIPSSIEVCGEAALFADADADEMWLQHFTHLAGSAGLRQELIDRGRTRVRAYSWRETAQGYLDLMLECSP